MNAAGSRFLVVRFLAPVNLVVWPPFAQGEAEERKPMKYPEPKRRELSEGEKAQIRDRIQKGQDEVYKLAQEFGCTSSQIAGINAALKRTQSANIGSGLTSAAPDRWPR